MDVDDDEGEIVVLAIAGPLMDLADEQRRAPPRPAALWQCGAFGELALRRRTGRVNRSLRAARRYRAEGVL